MNKQPSEVLEEMREKFHQLEQWRKPTECFPALEWSDVEHARREVVIVQNHAKKESE